MKESVSFKYSIPDLSFVVISKSLYLYHVQE